MKPRVLLLLAALVAVACGGPNKAESPHSHSRLVPMVTDAFREEATGDQAKAADLWLRALDAAATQDEDPKSVPVMMSALDALVHRQVSAFAEIAQTSALADRLPPKERASIDERLAKTLAHAEGPFAAHLVANARLALAERRGDAKTAQDMRARSGCAREALVFGPVAFGSVAAVKEPGALDRADAPVPAELAGPGPFLPKAPGAKVAAFGCHVPLYAQTNAVGVREVVVDVDAPKGGWIGVGLRTSSAAVLRVAGAVAIDRPYAMGAQLATKLARVEVTPGVVRLVARVAFDQDLETIQIGAWDASGRPLAARAPQVGAKGTSTAKKVVPVGAPDPRSSDELLVAALGALGARDARAAENLLHDAAADEKASPELLLAYARAVRMARDLPYVKASERARTAYERVLDVAPRSWEAAVEHAVLAGARRGHAEARLEALADLDRTRAKNATSAPALLDAFEASVAGLEHLYDRSTAAFGRAKGPLAGTALLRHAERAAFERTGKELAAFDCDANAPDDKTQLNCHHALVSVGDRAGAERELERLRALAGTSQLYLSLSSRNALEVGDLARAARIYDAMNPGDRQLSTLWAVKGKAAVPDLAKLAPIARDAPSSIPGLLRASGDDPLARYEGVAEKVVQEGHGDPTLANAATAVLAHDERYDVEANGLVHFVMLDVRRVMGTTDVEANAQASAPMLYGKDSIRVLRRRIFKKDGRIILPDRTPHAAQSHADLSQLEAGDAVEAVYEGWGLPGDGGNVGIDTPDLFPERTAVRDARIEIRLPPSLKTSMWSHPLLGKAEEKTEGGKRVLAWHVKERPIRRLESGVPKMDRNVMVSVSTTTWGDVARGLRETIASLDASSPEVTSWARESSQGKKPSRELVSSIVEASGKAVKEASGIALADVDLGRSHGGQAVTARTVLAMHEGTRTWLVVRALRELGVPTDVVVAENEPFSDSREFPPHFGRFMHPLAVAHVPGGGGATEDVWIDADVPGPPLPAGRVSPELRGRMALWPDGRIAPLPAIGAGIERDEIDVRLAVDDQGNAKGSLTVLLRGRSAQDIAEALVRIVGQERQRALRGIALAWVPFATVEKVELSSSEGSWQVAIRAELTAPAYAQIEGSKPGSRSWVLPGIDPVHYVFPRPYVTTLASTYASVGARENALAINHATQYHVRRRIELPAKAQILRLPGPFDGKGPLLSASRKTSVNGSTIEEDFSLDVSTGTVPRDRYDDFVDKVHRTDDAFRASTRVKPPSP
jgi:hypothetical protein